MRIPRPRDYSRERWLAVAAAALGLFIASVLLHNLIYGLFEVEEAFFFTLATIVSPLLFIGSLVAAAIAKSSHEGDDRGRSFWSFGPPRGRSGKVSLGLLVASGAGLVLFFVGAATGQSGGDTFFSNPYLATTILFAGTCAVLAGVAAAYSVVREGERSFGAFATIVFGVFVAIFALTEGMGHDEPDDETDGNSGTNSHTNLTVDRISAGSLRVSFDYGYHNDPPAGEITMLTVTLNDQSGEPLPGLPPTRLPETGDLPKGDGRITLDLAVSDEQERQVRSVRVCFAGEGHPDLGCATANFQP